MFLKRTLDIASLIQKKSYFLFGPRATGKSSLIKKELGHHALIIDLLHSVIYSRLLMNQSQLENIINAHIKDIHNTSTPQIIVIDEIQRIPALLNEVHRLIEKYHYNFLLTGGSARKLKKIGVNLFGSEQDKPNYFPSLFMKLKILI